MENIKKQYSKSSRVLFFKLRIEIKKLRFKFDLEPEKILMVFLKFRRFWALLFLVRGFLLLKKSAHVDF